MKKSGRIVLAGAVLMLAVLLAGCGGAGTPTNSTTPDATQQPSGTAYGSYQEILDAYSAKIRETTPGLVEEYKAEAANNTEGISGLAAISNDKVQELASISVEGTEKMADFMYNHGSGSTDEYMEWAGKLNDVYMEEAQKITDAYMGSAT